MRERGKDGYETLLLNTQNTEKNTKNIWNLLFPYTFRKNKHCPLQVVLLLQTDPKSLVMSHFLQSNLEQKMAPLFHIWKTRVSVRKTSKVWKDQTYSINKNFIAPLPIYTWSFCLTLEWRKRWQRILVNDKIQRQIQPIKNGDCSINFHL